MFLFLKKRKRERSCFAKSLFSLDKFVQPLRGWKLHRENNEWCFALIEVIWGLVLIITSYSVFPWLQAAPFSSYVLPAVSIALPDNSRLFPSLQLTRHHSMENYINTSLFFLFSSVKLQKQSPQWLKLYEHLSFTTSIPPPSYKNIIVTITPPAVLLTVQNNTENTFTCIVSLLWMCCRNIIFQVPENLVIFNFYHRHTWIKMPQHANNHKDYSSLVVIQWLSGG